MPDPFTIAKLCTAPVNGIISPLMQQAYAPYTYEVLQEKMDELKGKLKEANDMLTKLEEQSNGIKILNNDAIKWKKEAKDTLDNVETGMKHLQRSIEATCASGCLPNCFRRHEAKRSIQKEFNDIEELIGRYKPIVKGYRWSQSDFIQKTRGDEVEKIWKCLSSSGENNVRVVCIHGIAGVGKTAVAQAVCNKALLDENETFGYVIWVDAEYGITLKSLQEKIMRSMSIGLTDTDDDNERARRICDELVRRKKCLVIMDFLWENFTLRDIGIPEEEAEAEGVVCKVVLTSRSRLTCRNIPKNEFFEIKPLTESWTCFENNLCSTLSGLEDEAKDLVRKAVESCEGLPAEIIKLAHHVRGIMHGHSSSEIALSLKELLCSRTNSAPSNDARFRKLECSYRRLENTTHQHCFLYCALYPKGFPIEVEQLIDNWIWEGLLDNHIGSLEEKRRQGRNVLRVLKCARLLEKADPSDTQEAVKMLSFLHDMAVNIIFRDGLEVYINSRNDLTEFPPIDDQNGKIRRASFMHNKLGVLNKNQPNCPKLTTLLLQNNPLFMLSDNFFTRIPNLKLLDLSCTNISYLPSSICYLNFLQVLRLRHCLNLRSLPSLSKLEELIVLDLFGTPLEKLPLGMKSLKKLKHLNLSHTKLTGFEAGLVGALESLQELLLFMNDDESYTWKSKQSRPNSSEAYVEELSCLDGLRVLQLNFFDRGVFDEYMRAVPSTTPRPRALCFKFCVGGFNTIGKSGENSIAFIDEYPVDQQLPDGTLELYLSECRSSLSSINTLEKTGIDFQNLKVLNLYDCSNLTYLFTLEMLHCLQKLEKICVRQCWSVLGIIDSAANTTSSCCLLKLQELVLIDLPQLTSIYPGQQKLEWPAFRRFSVWNCDKLKRLPLIVTRDDSKVIILRGKSFKLEDDFANLDHEEADVPEDIVSFVSMKKPVSTSQTMPNNEQANYSRRKAAEKTRAAAILPDDGHETPPPSPGYIVRRLNNASSLLKEVQKKIGVLFY